MKLNDNDFIESGGKGSTLSASLQEYKDMNETMNDLIKCMYKLLICLLLCLSTT